MESKLNILLVDDYPANLIALSAVLSDPQYNLIEATSGPDAIRITQETPISLVLLDVQMPGMDGYEVARQIRQNPQTREVPIIFITAVYKEDPAVQKGYEAGGQDYMSKPFDPQILKAKVGIYSAKALRISQLEGENHGLREQARLLKASEERYRLIIEGAQEIIATIDFTGTITSLNLAFEKLTGHRCSEWVGKSFVPLLAPGDVPDVLEQFGESVRHDKTKLFQARMCTSQGDWFPVEISIQPLFRDGAPEGTIGVIRDISQRQVGH